MLLSVRFLLPSLLLIGSKGICFAGTLHRAHPEADFYALSSLIKAYKIHAGELPPPESGLKSLIERPPSLRPERSWMQIVRTLPVDPWGNPYHYVAGDGLKDGFGLYSCGPDGVSSSAGNDPDDWNSWSEMRPAEPAWVRHQKPAILIGGLVIATGAFMVGYRVAKREMRRA